MLFGLLRRSEGTRSGEAVHALADAARLVLDTARLEHLPLAYIAERGGLDQAQHWFATSILSIVAVQGRRSSEAQAETLAKELREGLTLNESMSALFARGNDEPRFVDLVVTKSEFKKYLRWARSVQ